eukprot:2918641-Alexandrium_andersonii.AAC.1
MALGTARPCCCRPPAALRQPPPAPPQRPAAALIARVARRELRVTPRLPIGGAALPALRQPPATAHG